MSFFSKASSHDKLLISLLEKMLYKIEPTIISRPMNVLVRFLFLGLNTMMKNNLGRKEVIYSYSSQVTLIC